MKTHRRPLAAFVAAILASGAVRFALTVNGVPDAVAAWASMTAVMLAAAGYFALRTSGRRERLIVSYVIVAPYMAVEVLALGYTWWTGRGTIFHAAPFTLGTSIEVHFWGHVAGGLTWEPLMVFGAISGLAWFFRLAGSAGR